MKKIAVACMLIMGAIFVAPGSASAQASGAVDVSITVNGFVILYYYSSVDIEIPSNVMAQALAGADTSGGLASTPSGSEIATSTGSGSLAVGFDELGGTAPGSNATLTIENAWAIRGLTANGVDVSVTEGTAPDLTSNSGSGTIAVNGVSCVHEGGDCDDIPTLLSAAKSGGVELNLGFSGITDPGDFSSSATYTITATVNP